MTIGDTTRIRDFLTQLNRCTSLIDLHDAFHNETIETGGSFLIPKGCAAASHIFEISLHGLTAFGATEMGAYSQWVKLAERSIENLEEVAQ